MKQSIDSYQMWDKRDSSTSPSMDHHGDMGIGMTSLRSEEGFGGAFQRFHVEEDNGGLKRGLKQRHIALLSIGGIIGTGLFLGTGGSLKNGGPLGLLLGYSMYGGVLICVMQGLGEMASYMPIVGGHLMYAGKFVDPALGFAMNWSYTIVWMLVCPAELSAVAVLFNYWIPDSQISNAVWITIAYVVVIVLNCFPAVVYGEVEFIFSSIKVITIIGLIISGIAINCGAGPTGEYTGFRFWKDPGAFAQYKGIEGGLGRFLGFWSVLTQASFSYFGSEIVAVAAAESKNPIRAVPRAIKNVYFRICLFYILGTFVIGLNTPSNDPRLGASQDAYASPFVIAIERAGIKVLPHIINACLISSAWSAANADIYIAGRSIFSLAKQGYLPKVFLKTTQSGTPIVASLVGSLSGCLAYMCIDKNANTVFNWFVNLIAVGGLMIYVGICITYIRFRAALDFQGVDRSALPFRSSFARAGAWIAVCVIPIIALFSGWAVFVQVDHFDVATFVTNYIPLIGIPALYFIRKLYAKTRILKLDEIDVYSGARILSQFDDTEPTTWGQKLHRVLF